MPLAQLPSRTADLVLPAGEPSSLGSARACVQRGCGRPQPRLLVLPGLHDSGKDHWQSWLQRRTPGSLRVVQEEWSRADLDAWSARIDAALRQEPPGPWLAVAHSFGCLALVDHLQRLAGAMQPPPGGRIVAGLLVAPANPRRFAAEQRLARRIEGSLLTVLASSNDPWLPTEQALPWAHAWGARLTDLGEAGHVNPASGFGPWPQLLPHVERLRQRWVASQRAELQVLARDSPLASGAGIDPASPGWLRQRGAVDRALPRWI